VAAGEVISTPKAACFPDIACPDCFWFVSQVLRAATGLLGRFISMREPNIKYLGLESLMRLAEVPAVAETIDKCVPTSSSWSMADEHGMTLFQLCTDGCMPLTETSGPSALDRHHKSIMGAAAGGGHQRAVVSAGLSVAVLPANPRVANIRRHQKSIMGALKEADISVRRRALDLLFAMATPANAPGIVRELLTYLTVADFSMREELVLKTAVLAEKWVDRKLENFELLMVCSLSRINSMPGAVLAEK